MSDWSKEQGLLAKRDVEMIASVQIAKNVEKQS